MKGVGRGLGWVWGGGADGFRGAAQGLQKKACLSAPKHTGRIGHQNWHAAKVCAEMLAQQVLHQVVCTTVHTNCHSGLSGCGR